MKFLDLVKLILDNLSRRKGRVALTAVGVVIGTAAVVVLISLALGLQQNYTSQLYGISDLTRIDVYPGFGEEMSMRMKGGGGGNIDASDMKMLTSQAISDIQAVPGVENVFAMDYAYGGGEMEFGRLRGYANMLGINTGDLADLGVKLERGVTTLDRGTAVIGGWVARNFYDPSQRPGQEAPEPPDLYNQQVRMVLYRYGSDGQMTRKAVSLRIVGVLKETRGEDDATIYVRLDELTAWNEWSRGSRINRNQEGYNRLIVKAQTTDDVIDVSTAINELGYQASTPQEFLQGINGFFTIMQIIFGGVGAIALLVAAIGIANTMTMAILERTREIGLMKAIGATNRDVLSIFLGEAAGIGFLGGLGGIILGWLGGKVLNVVAVTYLASQAAENGGQPMTMAAYTPVWLPLFALIFATLIGLLSGLYPALRAATLVPVTALKYE